MYQPFKDESAPINIKIPWDKNTARGFVISIAIVFFIVFLAPVFKIEEPVAARYEIETVPLELINFGEGDGTGLSKGNLADEGRAHKGKEPESKIHDAEIASKTKHNSKAKNSDDAGDYVPTKELSSDSKKVKDNDGTSSRNVGTANGSERGTGLGEEGSGPGLGPGISAIDWGGGGNRSVLYKKLPDYPDNANTSAQIKIKFTVSQDGAVIDMIPLQKGDPALEEAAMSALRQWRFNPLEKDKDMYGIITFTFKLS